MRPVGLFSLLLTALSLPLHAAGFKAEILETKVINKQEGRYLGWPSIERTKDGELLVVFSGDRDEHVCPWGKTHLIRSSDNGATWSEPETVNNTPLDDRDAGIIETEKGTLVVSSFTSLAFARESQSSWVPEEIRATWKRHAEKLSPETKREWLGYWVRRSEDGGKTWGDPIRTHTSSPHGPTQLKDGRLLYVGKDWGWAFGGDEESVREHRLTVQESKDDGLNWKTIGFIETSDPASIEVCWEPHAIELSDGRILALIRYEPKGGEKIMLQSVSEDGGKTWSVAESTGIWGLPPHLLELENGWVVCVYGHRREPYSERAVISMDGGRTWEVDNPITLSEAPNGDLGYPASVQLEDGSILTVFYQIDQTGEKTSILTTHWRLIEGE